MLFSPLYFNQQNFIPNFTETINEQACCARPQIKLCHISTIQALLLSSDTVCGYEVVIRSGRYIFVNRIESCFIYVTETCNRCKISVIILENLTIRVYAVHVHTHPQPDAEISLICITKVKLNMYLNCIKMDKTIFGFS